MNLKERNEVYGRVYMNGRKGREKWCKNIIISKLYSIFLENKLMKTFHGYSNDNSYKSQ